MFVAFSLAEKRWDLNPHLVYTLQGQFFLLPVWKACWAVENSLRTWGTWHQRPAALILDWLERPANPPKLEIAVLNIDTRTVRRYTNVQIKMLASQCKVHFCPRLI